MADPKLPKQLTEASPLDEFAKTGNVYVDPAFKDQATIDADPINGKSPITGETLTFGENTLTNFTRNSGNSPDMSPGDTHAIFVSNLDRGTSRGNNHDYFFNYVREGQVLNDIYIINSKGGDFSNTPRAKGNYLADSEGTLNVYIEGSTFGGNVMGFGSQTDLTQTFTGNYEFTLKNSTVRWFCITYGTGYGLGEGNANNNRFGTVIGNIDLVVEGSRLWDNGAVLRGAILPGGTDEKAYIRALFKDTVDTNPFGIIMTGSGSTNLKSTADLDITVTGSTFNQFMVLPNASSVTAADDGSNALTGDISVKVDSSTVSGLVFGAGRTGDNTDGLGWVKGNITFNFIGSRNTDVTTINKGRLGTEEKSSVVDGTIENSVLVGAFIGFQTASDTNEIHATTTLRVIGSTTGAFSILSSNEDTYFGTATLEITGSTTGNLAADVHDVAHSDGTFNLVFKASETQTSVGSIGSQWNTITVEAGANVKAGAVADAPTITINAGSSFSATSIDSEEGVLNLNLGALLNTGSINVETFNVIGTLEGNDVVIATGIGADGVTTSDGTIMVNGVAYTQSIFPGGWEIVGTDLVLHNASSTVFLVNSNYTDGAATDLGPKGYSTIANAEAAVTAKDTTTIIVTSMDWVYWDPEDPPTEGVAPSVFTEDVVAKDYKISFSGSPDALPGAPGEETKIISLGGFDFYAGGKNETVGSVDVSLSYVDDINTFKFSDVTGKANVSVSNGGSIGTLDMTGVDIADAAISFNATTFDAVKLANHEGFIGTVTIAGSTIGTVFGAKSGATADLTGGNRIETVYAEGNGDAIKLGTSKVTTYMVGSNSEDTHFDKLAYSDTVSATDLIIGGNKNTIGDLDVTIGGGTVTNLKIGGENDSVTGKTTVKFAGGEIENVSFNGIKGDLDAEFSGGHIAKSVSFAGVAGNASVTLTGGTVVAVDANGNPTTAYPDNDNDAFFYGIVYGSSISGALDGAGKVDTLNVEGNAKVGSVAGFKNLSITGGTLNIAGGTTKSELTSDNTLVVSGEIVNRRGLQAYSIVAGSMKNYGQVGVARDPNAAVLEPGITVAGDLLNVGYLKTSKMSVGGDFANSGKITAIGDISVTGAFSNSGEFYFRSTFDLQGKFHQEGGLVLNGVDVVNTGFISAATLSGVKNLTTSNMYITGGASVTGNLTVLAGEEVAFTNKANSAVTNGLTLGGNIELWDTSNLVVSGDLTGGTGKTITINVGDLIGANEVVRSETGLFAYSEEKPTGWTVNLVGENAGNYGYAFTEDETSTAVVVYSLGQVFVNSAFAEDKANIVDGNKLLYGVNAFATVAEAVAAAKEGAMIVIANDDTAMDVAAAGCNVEIYNSVVGSVTAKTVYVESDSTAAAVTADKLTINADAVLTLTGELSADALVIDATAGAGSRLVLDVDPEIVTIDPAKVTVDGKASYSAKVLPAAGEGEKDPAHVGDLYLISQDSVYVLKDASKVVDGDTFDATTGDALFTGTNVYTLETREAAEAIIKANGGVLYLSGFSAADGLTATEGVTTAFEFVKGETSKVITGIASTVEVFDGTHTTIVDGSVLAADDTVYGLNQSVTGAKDSKVYFVAHNVNQDFTTQSDWASSFVVNRMFITSDDYTKAYEGDIVAEIVDSKVPCIFIGNGSFGLDEDNPINIDVLIEGSSIGGFYGFRTRRDNTDPEAVQNINANVNIVIHDAVVGGTFTIFDSNNDHWNARGATLLQTYFTAGSINVEIGNAAVTRNLRVGGSLELGGKAFQAFNVPATLHIVATEGGSVTTATYVDEWDTLIVDATAQLQLEQVQYTTIGIGSSAPLDDGGTLTQVLINMSGYKSGTHTVITASNRINTDQYLSNISVIGDNDMTGQCELAFDVEITDEEQGLVNPDSLKKIIVFDKTDDMYINTGYNSSINGWHEEYQQELLYTYNAHKGFEKAFTYADAWHGTIRVTGGAFNVVDGETDPSATQDFHGNDVEIMSGATFSKVTLAADKQVQSEAVMDVAVGASIDSIDGSKGKINSTLNLTGSSDKKTIGAVTNFTNITVDKGASFVLGSVSGSNLTVYADNELFLDSLDLTGSSIVIDVTGYVDKPHVVISTEKGITGLTDANISFKGAEEGTFGYTILDGKELVLTTTIKSDTYLNAAYSPATTGTILEDGTYLEYGFNAFSDVNGAIAGLGSSKNTLTVTGGEFADDFHMNGASLVVEEGALAGIIYGTDEDFFSGMNITVESGSIGGISLVSGGIYKVTKSAITLGDGVTVGGSLVGAVDTTLVAEGKLTLDGGITGFKTITVDTDGFIDASSISGGTININSAGFTADSGNTRLLVTTATGIKNVTIGKVPGFVAYLDETEKNIYLVNLKNIYFDPTYTEETVDGKPNPVTGDIMMWGENTFNNLSSAIGALVTGGTLFANGVTSDIVASVGASIVAQGDGRFSVALSNTPGVVTGDVVIDVANAGLNNNGTAIINGSSGSKWEFKGNVTVNLKTSANLNEEAGQYDSGLAISKYVKFSGDENQVFTVNFDGSNGEYMSKNVALFRRTSAGDFDNLAKLEFNITDYGFHSGQTGKWFYIFSGDDGTGTNPTVSAPNVVMNLTNSYLATTDGNGWSLSLVGNGDGSRNTNYSVHLSGSTVDGIISGVRNRAQNAPGTNVGDQYAGTRTLYVDAGTNRLDRAHEFHHVVANANAELVLTNTGRNNGNNVSGALQFLIARTAEEGGAGFKESDSITIDVTGYEGADKMVISAPSIYYGGRALDADDFIVDEDTGIANMVLKVEGDTEGKFIAGIGFTKGVFIITKSGDVVYNPDYVDSTFNGTAAGNTFVLIDEQTPANSNAFDTLAGAKAAITGARADSAIVVTGIDEDEEHYFYAGGYKMELAAGTFEQVYGTDESASSVNSVELKISGGTFGNVAVAEAGKTVKGDANVTITGGAFGAEDTPEVWSDPVIDEETQEVIEPAELIQDAEDNHSKIVGSKDAVTGTSNLTIANTQKMYADISDFDTLTVTANATIDGTISVDTLAIDCNNMFTVVGDINCSTIHLVSADYEGPSKIVLTSDNLATLYSTATIVNDGSDRYYYDADKNNLWLVSSDPSNIYVNSDYIDDTINGTVTEQGDLLYHNINAFSDLAAAAPAVSSEYKLFIEKGTFNGEYNLVGVGNANILVNGDGVTINSLIVGEGAEGAQSRIEITGENVAFTSISGTEGAVAGYRVIADSVATTTLGSLSGVGYMRFRAGTKATQIDYITTGGDLVVDMTGVETEGVVLQTTGGIHNFIQYVKPEGEEPEYTKTVVGNRNNAANLMLYATDNAIVAAKAGAFGLVGTGFNANDNGTTMTQGDLTATKVYGYNVGESATTVAQYIVEGGTIFINGMTNGLNTSLNRNVNAVIEDSYVRNLQTGRTSNATTQYTRTGNLDVTILNSTVAANATIAGIGASDGHATIIVGEQSGETITDGVYNISIKGGSYSDSGTADNKFRIARYAEVAGGVVNVNFEDYRIEGDMMLFDHAFNVGDNELKEINVTMTNVVAPISKWWNIWDPEGSENSTNINVVLTGSTFTGDTFAFGLFGTHVTNWTGEATVTISGVTANSSAKFGGGYGQTNGGLTNINGTRTLKVVGDSYLTQLREFTVIDIADGVLLRGNTITMTNEEDSAFILRGEAGYTGDAKEYVVLGATILAGGEDPITAKFLDSTGAAIDGYKAIVGSTSVFTYRTTGDVFVNSGFDTTATGTAVTESDGIKNFIVMGDNGANTMNEAFTLVDARGKDKSKIQFVGGAAGDLYLKGYSFVAAGGGITRIHGGNKPDGETAAEAVDSVDITVNKEANVANIVVADALSPVTGNAIVTINDGAVLTGLIDGGKEFVGGTDDLVFKGTATIGGSTAKVAIDGFDNVTVSANSVVTLNGIFSGTTITIDATDFADSSKKVMTAAGGFGDTTAITVKVENVGEGLTLTGKFVDDNTLVVTSNLITDTYANGEWTADKYDMFVGDKALFWGDNAFNSAAAAAGKVGEKSTLFIEGGDFSAEAVAVGAENSVVISASTQTQIGSISGMKSLTVNAGVLTVTNGVAFADDKSTLTIDVTGYEQSGYDAVVLSTGAGFTNLTDAQITVGGEGAGAFHAYLEGNDVHLMKVNNYYVNTAFGEKGENIKEGDTDPQTGEVLHFGINAFYYLNDVRAKIIDGQGLYIYNRTNPANTNDVQVSDLYISGSTITQLVSGHTTGNHTYSGNVTVTIDNSTIAEGGESWLVSNSVTDNGYDALNRIFGNVDVQIKDSTIGGSNNQTLHLYNFTGVYGSQFVKYAGELPEDDDARDALLNKELKKAGITGSTVSMKIENTEINSDILFIGDSPLGNPYALEIAEGGYNVYAGATDLVITLDNVTTGFDRSWRIRGGSSNSHATVSVNISNSTIGSAATNNMVFAIENNWGDWGNPWNSPADSSDYVFTLENTEFNGYLLAGRADLTNENDQDRELPTYTGNRTLVVKGSNYVNDIRYFKAVNLKLTDNASLVGGAMSMYSTGAKINIDATGYEGPSKVLLVFDSIKNVKFSDINFTYDEGATWELKSDDDGKEFSTVVLKGAVKDIYVNGEYSAETLPLGAYYAGNNEALFFGENAFNKIDDALAALTVTDATLYVTGGGFGTKTLKSNSITIDASATLIFKGSEAVTIDGTLDILSGGAFAVDVNGFVGQGKDVVVLTANAINFDAGSDVAALQTNSGSYTLVKSENAETGKFELHLLQSAEAVYVSTDWADKAQGDEFEFEGKTLIFGADAFADGNSTAGMVAENGTITVVAGNVSFDAINRSVTARTGTVIGSSDKITAVGGVGFVGSLTLETGSSAVNLTVDAGSTLAVSEGVVVTGGLGMDKNAIVTFATGSTLDFDVTKLTAGGGAAVTNFSVLSGAPTFTITAGAAQAAGIYTLASGVGTLEAFSATLTVGAESQAIALGDDPLLIGDSYYTLAVANDALTLEKKVSHDVIYVSSTWSDKTIGDTVTIGDVVAVIGTDAFATGDAAVAAATPNTTFQVAGGSVSFTNGIQKYTTVLKGATLIDTNVYATLAVGEGATLAGKSEFGEGAAITVDGTVAFDTAIAGATDAQFTGWSKLTAGEKATYTLTDATQTIGTYLLATDAAGFNGTITYGEYDLTVDAKVIVGKDLSYTLGLSETGDLTLTIDSYTRPIPTYVYMSSDWSTKKEGDPITIGEYTAEFGYDAFATLSSATGGVQPEGTIEVVSGNVSFAGGYSRIITVDAEATVIGKAAFDSAITINGTFALDTANTSDTVAQFSGFDKVVTSETTKYTLNAAAVAGTYLLIDGLTAFTGEIAFQGKSLTVGGEAVVIDNFSYELGFTDNSVLALTVTDLTPPPVVVEFAYVNSADWTDKQAGDEVTIGDKTATIGLDAFKTADEAVAIESVKEIEVVNGEVFFSADVTKAVTIDAGAILTKTAKFDVAITINGTVAFDTAYAATDKAQFVGFNNVSGDTKYTLTDTAKAASTYLLADGVSEFTSNVTFGENTLTVGAEAITVGDLNYALTLDAGKLALVVTEWEPVVVVTNTFVNSVDWADKQTGDTVTIGEKTATIGIDAFVNGDQAYKATAADGTITVVNGEVSFSADIAKAVTIDATATLVNKATFTQDITINGTVAFDVAYATSDAAQFAGFSYVKGDAKYTLTAVGVAGTYLLATDAAGFTSDVALSVGVETATLNVADTEATKIGNFSYKLGITENSELALVVKDETPGPVVVEDTFVNSVDWADKQAGDEVTVGDKTATIGVDAFKTADEAAAVESVKTITVLNGEVFFTNAITAAVTINATATLTKKATFSAAITINGTVAFDTAYASADAAQFTGFSYVSGDTKYTLNAAAVVGNYLLATDAAGFNGSVVFGEYTLTVGTTVKDGDFSYTLDLTDSNVLDLTITKEGPGPEPPTITKAYVNSDWADKQAGDTVTIGEITATIGTDAFATYTAAAAVATVTDIEVAGGEITFNGAAIDKAVTIDATATLTGKAVFTQDITINGTVVFDTAYATATAAQITGYSFVKGNATYTLNATETAGTYLLATDAAGFNSEIKVGNQILTVGNEIQVGAYIYALGVTGNSELALSVSKVEAANLPDDGTNDVVYDKKAKAWNENITVENWIVSKDDIVYLDVPGSVEQPINNLVMHNMVGYNTPKADTGDAARIFVDDPAKLTFKVDADMAGTLFVYQKVWDEKKHTYKQVQVGKVAVKAGKTAYLKDVCVSNEGEYFMQMTANSKAYKKAGATGFYNVTVSDAKFFEDVDDGWNNVYTNELVQANPIAINRDTTIVGLDDGVETADDRNFVGGITDVADYAKLELDNSAFVSFNVTGDSTSDGAAKFTIWKFDAKKNKLTKVVNSTLKPGKYQQTTKGAFLDKTVTYYISMESSDAAKGKAVSYKVEVNTLGSRFFDSIDNGLNNELYDKKNKALYPDDGVTHHYEMNVIVAGEQTVSLDTEPAALEGFENYVGYGDKADYAKFTAATNGTLTFNVTATQNATFEVYTFNSAKGKLESLGKAKLSLGKNATTCTGTVSGLQLTAGTEYYMSMTAAKTTANDKGCVYYDVKANFAAAVNDAQLESALAAGAASGLESFQDESSWQNLAKLA